MAASLASRRRVAAAAAESLLGALALAGVEATSAAHALRAHSVDEGLHAACDAHAPHVVALPRSTEEVSRAVQLAAERRVPVVPFGAGTSLEGHIHALAGGLSVDTSRMDSVMAVHEADLTCTVQAGVRRKALNEHLRDSGMEFSVDPGADASLGGMAATRASGTSAWAFGTMRENVLGLSAVLASGEVLRCGGRARKSAAGYDLRSLLVGSEGTLGVISELTLRLRPRPAAEAAARCTFASVGAACDAAAALVQSAMPMARCELLDAASVAAVNAYSGTDFVEAPSLYLEWHGHSTEAAAELARASGEVLEAFGCDDFQFATDAQQRRALWEARHTAYWAILRQHPGKRGWPSDACLPVSRMAEFVTQTEQQLQHEGISAPLVGHAADGNVHFLFMVSDDSKEVRRVEAANARMVQRALALGGTCTGEHGLGAGKLKWLECEHGVEAVQAMSAIKVRARSALRGSARMRW